MSQTENAVTSSSGAKRAYRKGNPLSDAEKQRLSVARKRASFKEGCPSISDGRLSYQFSSDGYIRRSVYAYLEPAIARSRKLLFVCSRWSRMGISSG